MAIINIADRYKKRVYKTDFCSGCYKEIDDEYTEVILPDAMRDDVVTHIALCDKCTIEAEEHGAFN